jgi:hypothetical protein
MASTQNRRIGGRYELVRRIARGGHGTVWAGYDHLLERDVAVKHVMIPDDLPAPERELVRARVRSEARAAARLLHPSAVAIFDVVADEGDVHLVLELVEDPTLDELISRDGPMRERDAAAVGLRLLDVLMAAHARGIVHRDVKPSNIFVSDRGEVKLTDFGIAAVEGEARLTRTGATMGSPQFIAPEQAVGEDAAPPVDLWGLGACLYLAVEGVPPFERANAVATVHAVVHEEAREMQRARDLAPVVSRLLAKRPEDRPDEGWLREQLSAIAGIHTPPVDAEATTVLPVRTTPDADPPAAPAEPAAVPATEDGSDDTALSASVAVPPGASPARSDQAGEALDDERPRRWLPIAMVLAAVAVVGLAFLLPDAPRLAGDDGEVTAPAEDTADGANDEPATDDPATDTAPEAPADPDAGSEDDTEDTEDTEDTGAPQDTEAAEEPVEADEGDDGQGDNAPAADGNGVPEADVPEDWQVVDGPAYEVAVPADWQVQPKEGRLVDHRDPDSSTYLRVDWTPNPKDDPYADWQDLDRSLAERFEDYERHQLTRTTYRGEPAALLEYSYTAGGTRLHAYNLNLLAGDRAYALNLQSREEDWDEVEPMFAQITGGFQPDG